MIHDYTLPFTLPQNFSETLIEYGFGCLLVDMEIDDIVAIFHDEHNARLIAKTLNKSFGDDRFCIATYELKYDFPGEDNEI